jgi:hypothetical protein
MGQNAGVLLQEEAAYGKLHYMGSSTVLLK